jgi:hypothetical protein
VTTSQAGSVDEGTRPHNRVYRTIFVNHHGAPPYTCHFCDQEMAKLEHVHHLDHDPWNNSLANLAAAHAFCHNSAHHEGWKHIEDTRQRISQTMRAHVQGLSPEERRAKYGHSGEKNGFYGRSHTDEVREKLRQHALGRPGPKTVHTEETKRHLSQVVSALPRKWCDECQRDWSPSHWNRHVRKYHQGGKW